MNNTDSRKRKLCILVPAYNCAKFIEEVCRRVQLPGECDEIIVVDDCSPDRTIDVAEKVPRVYARRNERNLGYGGTSQRLYQLAVERDADYAISIHGDLGHRPEDIPLVVHKLITDQHDVVLGSRLLYILESAAEHGWWNFFRPRVLHGMPWHRALGHVLLTRLQNRCFGTNLHCFHDGMRGVNRQVIDWIVSSELPLWYNYDTELLLQAHRKGFRIGEVPVKPFYENNTNSAAPPIRYGLKIAAHAVRTALRRLK